MPETNARETLASPSHRGVRPDKPIFAEMPDSARRIIRDTLVWALHHQFPRKNAFLSHGNLDQIVTTSFRTIPTRYMIGWFAKKTSIGKVFLKKVPRKENGAEPIK